MSSSTEWGRRLRWLAVASLIGLVISPIPVVRQRAERGKTAFVRWREDTHAVWPGVRPVYFVDTSGGEGFPGPPITLALLTPLHALGPVQGSLVWLALKGLLMAATLWLVVESTRGRGPPWPPWAVLGLILLAARPFHDDLTHGNLNVLIA